MSIKSGQAVTVLFSTANATTGAAADATGTPAGTLYVNGTANGATVTVTNITTGVYKAAVTLPALSAGDIVSLRVAATVNAVAGEGIVWQDVADTKRVSDLADLSAAAVNAEVDTALSDYDGPTNAELAAAIAAGDDAVLAAVADVPTNAELATALGTADDATLAAIAALTIPSAATIADAVWDEATAGHAGAGSTGAALSAAGAAGDPWATTLPGGYTGEQAGNIIDRIDAQLATSAAAVVSAVADGDNLTGYRGDSFTVNFTDLGNVAARTKLWFTAKRKASDADDDAMIQIRETTGLLYINGAAAVTAANGSLTVTDAPTGDMSLVLAAEESAKMPVDKIMVYDIQMLTASGVSTLAAGTLAFSADVTRAVS